jgi:spore coat protein U-like protein
MQVSAEIKNGCTLNSSKTSGVNLGTIQFGTPVLNRPLEAASTENGGSIVLICTPGTSVSISLNAGSYSNNLFMGRKLKHLQKDIMLPYQLYQDRGYKLVWGEGENSRTITATGGKDVFTVYAKLFSLAAFPPPGTYQDIVTVTINY